MDWEGEEKTTMQHWPGKRKDGIDFIVQKEVDQQWTEFVERYERKNSFLFNKNQVFTSSLQNSWCNKTNIELCYSLVLARTNFLKCPLDKLSKLGMGNLSAMYIKLETQFGSQINVMEIIVLWYSTNKVFWFNDIQGNNLFWDISVVKTRISSTKGWRKSKWVCYK